MLQRRGVENIVYAFHRFPDTLPVPDVSHEKPDIGAAIEFLLQAEQAVFIVAQDPDNLRL
jgi:hypothetical protein